MTKESNCENYCNPCVVFLNCHVFWTDTWVVLSLPIHSRLKEVLLRHSSCRLHHLLGDFLQQTGDLSEALNQYSFALSLNPHDIKVIEAIERLEKNEPDSTYDVEVEDMDGTDVEVLGSSLFRKDLSCHSSLYWFQADLEGSDLEGGWSRWWYLWMISWWYLLDANLSLFLHGLDWTALSNL